MPASVRTLNFLAGCALFLGCICSALHARAATTLSGTEVIRAYRGNVQLQGVAEASFRAFEAKLSTHCGEVATHWDEATYVLSGQPEVDDKGRLVRAAWEERVPGVACGRSRLYRVRVQIADGKGSVLPMLPGDGLSSPDLPEAEGAVRAAMRATLPAGNTCAVDVVDTRLRANGLVDSHAPWTEIWTVSACGRRFTVPVRFTPQPQAGTDIDIEVAAIRNADESLLAAKS